MKNCIAFLMLLWAGVAFTQSHSEVRVINGIPIIYLDGSPFNVSGWMGGMLDPETVAGMKAQMDVTASQGFTTTHIRVPWHTVEELADNDYNWVDVDSLINYAQVKGLKVIIDIGPFAFAYPWQWYWSIADANDGFMKNQFGEYPVIDSETWYIANFYHEDWYTYAGDFVAELVTRYKDRSNLLGWMILPTWTGENNYPCIHVSGYENEMFDYSDYSANLFGTIPPAPIEPHFNDTVPDDRPLWRDWMKFRNTKKRECYSYFGTLIDSLDPNHILGVFSHLPLGGGGFHDPWALTVTGYEYYWLINQDWVDFIREGGLHLNSVSFEMAEFYAYYINYGYFREALNYGKAVINEPTKTDSGSSRIDDILAVAAFLKSLGVYHTWYYASSPGIGYEPWTFAEVSKIGETNRIVSLAQPEKLTRPRLAIVDFPYEHTFYYTQKYMDTFFVTDRYTVHNNMEMINAFIDAGIPFDVVCDEEIIDDQSILTNYDMIVLTFPKSRIATYVSALDTIFNDYEISGGIVREMDKLFAPQMKNYYMHRYYGLYTREQIKTNVIEPLRDTIDFYGISRHSYSEYGIIIYGLKPYLFCYSADTSFSGEIQFDIPDWDLSSGATKLTDRISGNTYSGEVVGEKLIVNLTLSTDHGYLFEVELVGVEEENAKIKVQNAKLEAHPNPFIRKTIIEFTVHGLQFTDKNRQLSTVNYQLQIYDLAGRLVKTFPITQLPNNSIAKIVWDGKNDLGKSVRSGIYFYKLKAGDKFSQTKKLLLLK